MKNSVYPCGSSVHHAINYRSWRYGCGASALGETLGFRRGGRVNPLSWFKISLVPRAYDARLYTSSYVKKSGYPVGLKFKNI